MGKVNIGLRGWRFDESEVLTDEGDLRPFDEMSPDTRRRVVRLSAILGSPCDACWLVHGDENLAECNVVDVVYGEPLSEVRLCVEHESEFVYWFREAGGSDYRGREELQDAFHEWFDDGGRAPDGYEGIEHVDTDPESVPTGPDPSDAVPPELKDVDPETLEALDVDLSVLDVDRP